MVSAELSNLGSDVAAGAVAAGAASVEEDARACVDSRRGEREVDLSKGGPL